MIRTPEAFRVNLVNVLRAGWSRREPAVFRHDFQPANGRAVVPHVGEDGLDLLAGEVGGPDLLRESFFNCSFCSGVAGASTRS